MRQNLELFFQIANAAPDIRRQIGHIGVTLKLVYRRAHEINLSLPTTLAYPESWINDSKFGGEILSPNPVDKTGDKPAF